MGHIAHLRKQFKSINTYDYNITLITRRKNPFIPKTYILLFRHHLPLEKGEVIHLNKLDSPWVVRFKLAQRFWRRKFFKLIDVFSLFRNYLPWKRTGPIISPKECFVPNLVEIGPVLLEKILKCCHCIFAIL